MLLNKELFNQDKIIIFEVALDREDCDMILSAFKKWLQEEYDKRACKNGKLFQFSYCNEEVASNIFFENKSHTKYLHLMEGYCGDYLEQQKRHKDYQYVVEEILKYADAFVAENGLTKSIEKTEGLARNYIVSR